MAEQDNQFAQIELKPKTGLLQAFEQFRRWPVIPVAILFILTFAAITAPFLAPYHPVRGDLRERSTPPFWQEGGSMDHILGTDHQGRDILSRMMHGARVSLTFAAMTMAIGVALGALLGAVSGYFGGHVDEVIMRLVDLTNALPFLLAALVVVSVFGASFRTLLIILSLFAWGGYARQVRGEVLQLKEMDYVALAKVAGASPIRIIWKHLLPGVTNTLIVVATLGTGADNPGRVNAQLPGRWDTAAQPGVGQHGIRRTQLYRDRMVDSHHTRRRNRAHRPGPELPGRLAARLPRPAPKADMMIGF